MNVTNKFAELAPWVTKFTIDGHTYGGDYDAAHDARITDFHAHFPDVTSILELGSLEGGHTVCLAQLPGVQRVVAIEGRPENIERAQLVVELLDLTNVTSCLGDLATLDPSTFGRFDVIFNCGLLYHLADPWRLLVQLAQASPRMYLSTHYSSTAEARAHGYEGRWYTELGRADPLSGLGPTSFCSTCEGLFAMLDDAGWNDPVVTFDEESRHGPHISLATATRENA